MGSSGLDGFQLGLRGGTWFERGLSGLGRVGRVYPD